MADRCEHTINKRFNFQVLCLTLVLLLVYPLFALSVEEDDIYKLGELSLEELLKVEIETGTLTGVALLNAPISVTIISSDDIEITPARDLMDLLEVYVPGAFYVTHFNGPRFGFRGIISDQNYSYLLLLNGININLKTTDGPFYEILNKDLADIQRIEIIRGPGSVTHGPGAIGGVINIITKRHEDFDGLEVGLSSDFSYRSLGGHALASFDVGDLAVAAYASIVRSEGLKDTNYYYIDWTHGYGYGFMGPDWGNKGKGTAAPLLFGDYLDEPEVKLNLDVDFRKEWRFLARYSSFSHIKTIQQNRSTEGPAYYGLFGKLLLFSLENTHTFSSKTVMKTRISFDSANRRDIWPNPNYSIDDVTRRNPSYSENEINIRTQLNHTTEDGNQFAIGAEFLHEFWRAEIGESDESFLLVFQQPLGRTVLTADSPHSYTSVDNNINANMFGIFGEANLQIADRVFLTLSARADKHEFAEWAYSPRLAFVMECNPRNFVKATAQRSVRLGNFTDLYSEQYISDTEAEPEVLTVYELSYRHIFNNELTSSITGFYETVDQIAWINPEELSDVFGTFEAWGMELEASYVGNSINAGGNFSYIKQIDWKPVTQPVSHMFNPDGEPMPAEHFAENRLNNLPGGTLKGYVTFKVADNVTVHLNARANWDYNQIDMLDMYLQAHNRYGTVESKQEMQAIYDDVLSYGYSRPSLTSNASLKWTIPMDTGEASLKVFCSNILSNNQIRYIYQFWEAEKQYPRQVGFLEEPVAVGLVLTYKY